MDTNQLVDYTSELIRIRSISGNEAEISCYLHNSLKTLGFKTELIPVDQNRRNVFAYQGRPEIVFSTHMDVVPAPDRLFIPRIEGERIFGRGACDAKGIIACMIAAAQALKLKGVKDIGLLFVVGEETKGDGARCAALALRDRGIKYVINGEPTDCQIATAHKGALDLRIRFLGKSAHSGYPEKGDDANLKLIKSCNRLIEADFGQDPELGSATLNLGVISGGSTANTISDRAELRCTLRTVSSNGETIAKIRDVVGEAGQITVEFEATPARMLKIPGFQTFVAGFCSDIPNFSALGAEFIMYGPGSILCAHSDNESIAINEMIKAVTDYQNIFHTLSKGFHRPSGE